jgi:hypothetical protein
MRIYLSGPISQDRNYKQHFEEARDRILMYPHEGVKIEVISPTDLSLEGESWEYCMRETIKLMLTCECVVLLPTIQYYVSEGVVLEQLIAKSVGMNIWIFDDFLKLHSICPF